MKKELPDILSDLIYKDFLGALTEKERQELAALIKRYPITAADRAVLRARMEEEEPFNAREAYLEFVRRTRRRIIFRRLRIAAAIALLIGCGGMAWWFYQPATPVKAPVEMATVQPILPGSSKAVITLSNGERIELENLNRQLQESNGTRIEAANGSLTYSDTTQSQETLYNEIAIPRGGEFHLTMADGTQVWLNADTRLKYPVNFNGKTREVFLQGEAYFEVAPNAEQPFLVNTTRGCIQVLGTAFNVRDYAEEKKVVTVLESGKVRYTTAGKQQESRELRPGFLLEDAEGQHLHARQVNTRLYTEWRNGKYIFENASVEEIMSTLQRWYNIDVIYADEKVKQLHFTGDLERYETFDVFLHFMETGGDIRFQIKDNIVIVNKK